jgi:hypothetical protein
MAAPQAAVQAPPSHAFAPGKSDGDTPDTGFAQALFAAGFTDVVSSPTPPLTGNASVSTSFYRNAKNAKQQLSKEPSKDAHKNAVTVPVMNSLQTTLAPPLRIQAFSRETENHEQSGNAQSSVTAETSPPTVNTAPVAHAESGKAEPARAANADAVRETPAPAAPQNPPPTPSGDLAFAARVQPVAAASAEPSPAPRPMQHDVITPEQAKKAAEKNAAEATAVQPVAAGADASLSSSGQHGQLGQYTNAQTAPSSPAAASSVAAAPAPPLKPVEMKVPETQAKAVAGPLKDISVQVSQPGDQKVEVRVVQQSGELRVAVRTGDSDLAHGMQQGLSDLVGRLQDNGFRAEAWRPGGTTAQSGAVLETRSSPSGSQNGDSQSSSGNSHQQQGERRQNQSQRPGWVDELESSIAGGQQFQGVTYGIGS